MLQEIRDEVTSFQASNLGSVSGLHREGRSVVGRSFQTYCEASLENSPLVTSSELQIFWSNLLDNYLNDGLPNPTQYPVDKKGCTLTFGMLE
jgi:hypothetical protein